MPSTSYISNYIRESRARAGMTQQELAAKAAVGLRFIRDLEQGKNTLRIDKVNQVLALFGATLIPGKSMNPYEISAIYLNKRVRIYLKNKSVLTAIIIDSVKANNEIRGWRIVSKSSEEEFKKGRIDDKEVTEIDHTDIERIENIN